MCSMRRKAEQVFLWRIAYKPTVVSLMGIVSLTQFCSLQTLLLSAHRPVKIGIIRENKQTEVGRVWMLLYVLVNRSPLMITGM